jgi:hypothetical protein
MHEDHCDDGYIWQRIEYVQPVVGDKVDHQCEGSQAEGDPAAAPEPVASCPCRTCGRISVLLVVVHDRPPGSVVVA